MPQVMAGLTMVRGMMVINGSKIEEDMIMKNIFRISALMCAMAFLTTSCVKDELFDEPQQKPAAVGDEIIFGSRAGFENSDKTTRTVYSGETYKVTINDEEKTFERIDWVDGTDRVQIYCEEASGTQVADYVVYDSSTDEEGVDVKDEGYLVNPNSNTSGAALQWGSEGTHNFYAMYPATSQFDLTNNTLAQGVKMDGTKLMGIVPSAQVPARNVTDPIEETTENGKKVYVVKPNMDYAYMAAKATATPADGSVQLDFVPIVTALEIELVADQETKILELMLYGTGLAGGFKADLSNWTGTYPTCENLDDYQYTFVSDGSSTTSTLKAVDNIVYSLGELITLQQGEKLRFTMFLRPGADYNNLTLGFSETGAAYLKNNLGDGSASFNVPAHKKTRILGVNLPKAEVKIVWDASNWMEALPDDREMRYLSLPGTGGSFSYEYNDGEPDAHYQSQTLDIAQQWKAGIRAFEVIVDRPSSSNTTLGGEAVRCNNEPMGNMTFAGAMTTMVNNVTAHPNECAVVILTYQPRGGWFTPERNCQNFAKSLKKWYDNLSADEKSKYVKYTPNATLRSGDNSVAGKVLLMVRMHQRDEDADDAFGTAAAELDGCPFVIIEGCGTAKDRWGARGYTINNKRCYDISNKYSSDANIIETYMHDSSDYSNGASNYIFTTDANGDYTTTHTYTNGSTTYLVSRPANGSPNLNFGFETADGTTCWYQEWARVVETPLTATWSGNKIYWFESLSEKKSNIEQTFEKALGSDPSTSQTIFINSLCGYLVQSDFSASYTPSMDGTYGGSGGDIAGLANKLNPWFLEMVKGAQFEQSTGPTGVVMMDRVTENMEVIGMIISNNFKYNK